MDESYINRWKSRSRFFMFLFVASALIWGVTFFVQGRFPDYTEMDPSLMKEPLQTTIEKEDFTLIYRGKNYVIHPVAEYDISGFVVSHNNIHAFWDVYHTDDSVDLKDICLIWGNPNLSSNDFHKVKFWNVSWTCNWEHERFLTFDSHALSNNHLLASDPQIQNKIRSIRKGDEVHIRGMLVNYHPEDLPEWSRKTSTVRTDSGNCACEVVFVEELEFLDRGTPLAYQMHSMGFYGMILFLLLRILSFFLEAREESLHFEKKQQYSGEAYFSDRTPRL